jgi:Domain of unknown function (DUF6851)/VCPO second helical-bundle domain
MIVTTHQSPYHGRAWSLIIAATACACAGLAGCSDPTAPLSETGPDSLVVQWDQAALRAIRAIRIGPPMGARVLAITHTAMYDAWAAYDARAAGTRFGTQLRRSAAERTEENKRRAVSYAAYRALSDLFPGEQASLDSLMRALGYDHGDASTDLSTAVGVGNVAAAAVLEFRHHDGSNQLGDLAPGEYEDYTGYAPVNSADQIVDPNHWQPLRVPDGQGGMTTQRFIAPHWGLVTPFALTSGAQFRPAAVPNLYPSAGYAQQVQEILDYSAGLTDEQKVIAEYWSDGPRTELPPGHWALLAQWVSARDQHGVDQDVKMFFALTNAMLDASIAVWDCKRTFDYVRPITAVRFLFNGQPVRAWGGPFKGTQVISGENWLPYQSAATVTPAFPEFSSGHSAFSAAAAEVLRRFTGSDQFGASFTFKAGASRIEPRVVPAQDVVLSWATFSEAADQAGLSRRYGGIHFAQADVQSRTMGRQIGAQAWTKALQYFDGVAAP